VVAGDLIASWTDLRHFKISLTHMLTLVNSDLDGTNLKLSDFIKDRAWDAAACTAAISSALALQVMFIPLSCIITEDSLQWVGRNDGSFNVKEAYHLFCCNADHEDDCVGT